MVACTIALPACSQRGAGVLASRIRNWTVRLSRGRRPDRLVAARRRAVLWAPAVRLGWRDWTSTELESSARIWCRSAGPGRATREAAGWIRKRIAKVLGAHYRSHRAGGGGRVWTDRADAASRPSGSKYRGAEGRGSGRARRQGTRGAGGAAVSLRLRRDGPLRNGPIAPILSPTATSMLHSSGAGTTTE